MKELEKARTEGVKDGSLGLVTKDDVEQLKEREKLLDSNLATMTTPKGTTWYHEKTIKDYYIERKKIEDRIKVLTNELKSLIEDDKHPRKTIVNQQVDDTPVIKENPIKEKKDESE